MESMGTGYNTFIDGLTKSGSTMTIGMFGQDDYYFFFLRIKPPNDYLSSGTEGAFWF